MLARCRKNVLSVKGVTHQAEVSLYVPTKAGVTVYVASVNDCTTTAFSYRSVMGKDVRLDTQSHSVTVLRQGGRAFQ